ncbi:MAG TPA: M56 family metallopeptidase [Phycisphaerae bacterium]|nr:M56 family metallopeptidase [Phycisphaerae bacterium]
MNVIEMLNAWGGVWADFAWARLIDGAVVLAVVATLWLLIRRWASPQLGYCLFLLVLVKLVIPIKLTVPQRLADWWPHRMADRAAAWVTAEAQAPAVGYEHRATMARAMPPVDSDRGMASVSVMPARPPSSDPPAAEQPAVSIQALLMSGWAAAVAALLLRFAWVQWRTHRLLRRAKVVDPRSLPIDPELLCRSAGVRRSVRVLSSDAVHSPAAWGLLRSCLIVPPDFLVTFTPNQMRWILLHELAHIRRADVLVVTLQRLLQIAYFFNPVVWVANWAIDLLREYACDDAALVASKSPCRDCGEGFLSVVQCANKLPALAGTPVGLLNRGILIRRRLMRILDTHRKVRTGLSVGTAVLLLAAAAILLPSVQAADSEAPDKPNLSFEKFPIEQANYYVTQGLGPPPTVGKPFDFCQSDKCLYWPCRKGVMVQSSLLFDESGGAGTGYDKLYVDFNGDGDFEDEDDAVYEATPCGVTAATDGVGRVAAYFENVHFTQNPVHERYAHAQVFLNCVETHRGGILGFGGQMVTTYNCLLIPQQWAVGAVTIGGRAVHAALIDRDWNDKVTDLIGLNINEYAKRTPRGDYLVLDIEGVGELKPGRLKDSGYFAHGVGGTPRVILAPYLALDSGTYEVQVEQVDNGVKLKLVELSDVPVGRLAVDGLANSEGLLNLVGRQYSVLMHTGGQEEVTVPADVYLLPRYERSMRIFEVLAGKTTVLASPPQQSGASGRASYGT